MLAWLISIVLIFVAYREASVELVIAAGLFAIAGSISLSNIYKGEE